MLVGKFARQSCRTGGDVDQPDIRDICIRARTEVGGEFAKLLGQ